MQATWEDANGEPVGMAAQQLMRSLPGHMIRALEVAQAEATAANDLAQVSTALRHVHALAFALVTDLQLHVNVIASSHLA